MEKNIRKMVIISVYAAIVIIMTIIPFLGYINYGTPIEATLIHIIVILAGLSTGIWGGAIVGGVWGVTCLMRAFTSSAFLPFQNPLVSVLPRILVGIVAALVFMLLSKKFKLNKIISAVFAAILGSATNTVFVIGMLNITGGTVDSKLIVETFDMIINAWLTIQGAGELVLAAVVCPALYAAVNRVLSKENI